MKTIEQFDAEQAKARDAFVRELALLESAPMSPKFVSNIDSNVPWISYDAKDLDEAVAIINGFGDRLPMVCVRNGCTVVMPEQYLYKDYVGKTPVWEVESCIESRCSTGRGFCSVQIAFYPADRKAVVVIDVKNPPARMRGYIACNYSRDGEVAQVVRKEAPSVTVEAEKALSFGGGSRDSADWRAYFSSVDALVEATKV